MLNSLLALASRQDDRQGSLAWNEKIQFKVENCMKLKENVEREMKWNDT